MKTGTVALIIEHRGVASVLVESLSDDQEILIVERAIKKGESAPLDVVYTFRKRVTQEDEEFGDYVEDLLCQPFVRTDIQKHGVQWLKSKIKIEEFRRSEDEATKIIAEYAFKVYMDNPQRTDFFLAGPTARIRIRIFEIQHQAAAA